jgi:ATP-dependent Zn protease
VDPPYLALLWHLAVGHAPKEYSEATAQDIDAEVRQIMEAQFTRVTTILTARQRILREAAAVLLRKETITGEELQAIASQTEAPRIHEGANATTIH